MFVFSHNISVKGEISIARQVRFIANSALVLSLGEGRSGGDMGRTPLDVPFISGELCVRRRATWWGFCAALVLTEK